MKDAVVFNQGRPLDFEDVRAQIARIPEVMLKLREAQDIWDAEGLDPQLNFYSTLMSEDQTYFASSATRSLLAAVVQIGLFERLTKSHAVPAMIVGNVRNDSAIQVAMGQKTLRDLIVESRAAQAPQNKKLTVLQGQEFPSFQAFKHTATGFQPIGPATEDLEKALAWLAERENVRSFISVGPGSLEKTPATQSGILSEVSFAESIDKDPLLGWFWQSVKSVSASA